MKILAFDTSTAQGSVAVLSDERVLSEKIWRRAQSHSEFLTSEIESALHESLLKITDIDALAVGQGPGSFTGIRVAINAARALAYALKRPAFVFDTAETLVFPVTRRDLPMLVLLSAQKNSFYVARFEGQTKGGLFTWRRTRELSFMSVDEVQSLLSEPHLCVGDGCVAIELALCPDALICFVRDSTINDFPLASSLARLVTFRGENVTPSVWNAIQPLYIRASGAEEKLREGTKS